MIKNSIVLKTIVLLFFLGGIAAYVLYRIGYFETNEMEKDAIINAKINKFEKELQQEEEDLMGGSKSAGFADEKDIEGIQKAMPKNNQKKVHKELMGGSKSKEIVDKKNIEQFSFPSLQQFIDVKKKDDFLLPGSKTAPVFEK
jgi:hypothetical protein